MSTCNQLELAWDYAIGTMPAAEVPGYEAHLPCEHCRREVQALDSIINSLAAWPADVLNPSSSLQDRLASRIAAERDGSSVLPPPSGYLEPEWEEVAPGIFCKLLANDTERDRVSMLVRLLPGIEYPPHTHAWVEELYLLDGELWIDDRKLYPGDYNYAEAPTGDRRVWSETGCTCVLITSTQDILS